MTKIQQTEDYSSFKRINGNRTINKAQVMRLYNSFNVRPELASAVPVIVNDKMEIIDGQHRLMALEKLGLPVYYFNAGDLSLQEVQILNSGAKHWSPMDYAKSFAELGNENYKTYLEFRKKYGLPHATLLLALTSIGHRGGGNTSATFKAGELVVGDLEFAHKFARSIKELIEIQPDCDSRVFAVAFKRAMLNPEYDHERMITKMRMYGSKIIKDAHYAEDYMRQLERIYNHHNGSENRIKLF